MSSRNRRSLIKHRWVLAAAVALVLSLATADSAAALGKKEISRQNAIAKAGRVLLVKSLQARIKCAAKDIQDKNYDPAAKVTKAENKASTQIVKACTGVTLNELNSGSCSN